MVICSQCGTENEIGRMFCMECGTKLELQDMTSANLNEMLKIPWWKRYMKWLALIPVAIIVLLVVLRFWPNVERIGTEGNGAGRMRVIKNLELITSISDGTAGVKSAEVTFDEKDINAYLRYEKDSLLGVRSSVDIGEGFFIVRVVRPRLSWGLPKGLRFEPDASYDLTCSINRTRIIPRKARIGHSRAGLSKKGVVKRVAGIFAGQSEWETLKLAEGIKLKRDRMVVTVEKR